MEKVERDPKADDDKEKTASELLVNFMGYTTAHGFGRLADSKTVVNRIFWSLVSLGAFGMAIFAAYEMIELFFSRPISTQVTMVYNPHLSFPAVTICNLNVMRKDAMPEEVKREIAERFLHDVSKVENDTAVDKTETTTSPMVTSDQSNLTQDSLANPTSFVSDPGGQDYDSGTYTPTESNFADNVQAVEEEYDREIPNDDIRSLWAILETADKDQLYNSGHLFSDLVKNCTWKGFDCTTGPRSNYWSESWDYKYGRCYTFNGGFVKDGKESSVLKVSSAGPWQALILTLDIEQSQYVGQLSKEAGVRVVIHDQGVMPFPFEEGFSVSPGLATSIGIRKTNIVRLDRFENNSCWPANKELPQSNIYRKYKNITRYSLQVCLNSCLGLSQQSDCNCSEHMYPSPENVKSCNLTDPETKICLKDVKLRYSIGKLDCFKECQQPCESFLRVTCACEVDSQKTKNDKLEQVFETTISSSQWPSEANKKLMVEASREMVPENNSGLALQIFYNDVIYHKIEEHLTYERANLLADIGGQLGLWIGISAMTCCEVLELIMMLFVRVFNKCLDRKSRRVNQIIEVQSYEG